MAFNPKFWLGASKNDIANTLNYTQFLKSTEEIEELKLQSFQTLLQPQKASETSEATTAQIATIKNELILNE